MHAAESPADTPVDTHAPAGNGTTRRGDLRYLPGLDGLRAVSVIAVLLYHADVADLPGGFLGVEVFFVVSGYLITSLLLQERRASGTINLREFWTRRARRLLPALYVVLAAVIAYSLLFLPDAIERLKSDVVAALLYVSNWWQIVGEQSYFAEGGRPPLLLHLWSLAIEEQFYLLWPIVLAFVLSRWSRGRVMTGILIGALASAAWMALAYQPYSDPSYVYYGTHTRLSGLLLGALLAFVWAPYKHRRRPGRGAGAVVDGAGLLGLVVIAWSFTRVNDFDPFVYRGGFLLLGAATVLAIAAVVHPSARLGRLLGVAPLVWIGLRSYGIYLWHWPVFAVTRPGLDLDLHGRPLLVFRLAVTFLLADLSYRLVEQPIRRGAIGGYMSALRASRGTRRGALLGRGALVSGSAALAVTLLVVGLANATGNPAQAAGRTAQVASASGGVEENPSAPVAAAAGLATSTTSPPTSTTVAPTHAEVSEPATDAAADLAPPRTTAPAATAAPPTTSETVVAAAAGAAATADDDVTTTPTTLAPTTTTTPPPPTDIDGARVIAIGDSVMLGASAELEAAMPGIFVDAKVSRAFVNAIDVVSWYAAAGLLRDVVVVHMGTNGAFSDAQFDQIMGLIGPDRLAVFVTAHVPRTWEGAVNERLTAGTQRWANAVLADWKSLSTAQPSWFAQDGFHLEKTGAAIYSDLIESTVLNHEAEKSR